MRTRVRTGVRLRGVRGWIRIRISSTRVALNVEPLQTRGDHGDRNVRTCVLPSFELARSCQILYASLTEYIPPGVQSVPVVAQKSQG